MFKIFGDEWYLDLNHLDAKLRIDAKPTQVITEEDGADVDEKISINVVSYEVYKFLIEVLLTEKEDIDENMGMRGSDVPIDFKLAFNTLVKDNILKKTEDDDR
jgi:hypothetical protein